MKRRQFIGLLGGAAVAATSSAHAQQPAMPVVGFLNGASADGYAPMVVAFRQGLKQLGYVEGRNVAIEFRWADGHYDRLPAMAADLVRRQVSVIAATSTPANLIAKAATGTIPIVFTTAGDPVQLGLIASLSRPGGNVTGVTQLNVEVSPKWLELARELMPGGAAVALLVNPANPNAEIISKNMQAVAQTVGLQLRVLHASKRVRAGKRLCRRAQAWSRRACDRCRRFFQWQEPIARRAFAAPCGACDLPLSRIHRGGWFDELWWKHKGILSHCGGSRRQDPHA